jgi:hypothetical protein
MMMHDYKQAVRKNLLELRQQFSFFTRSGVICPVLHTPLPFFTWGDAK